MINLDKINDFSNKIKEITNNLPISDTNKNIHALLKSMLTKMELVSRDEFDVQSELLIRTQAKLADLEHKLAALESLLKAKEAAEKTH